MRDKQIDDLRFELNKWVTQPTLVVQASSFNKDPVTGKLTMALLIELNEPAVLLPGMKIIVVPE